MEPHRQQISIIVASSLLLIAGCAKKEQAVPLTIDGPLPEFIAAAEGIEQSNNPYFGRLQIAQLTALFASPDQPAVERAKIHAQLCREFLRLGDLDAARSALEAAASVAGSPPPTYLLKLEAIFHLRAAEVANCIDKHNPRCCIFPLASGGVHETSGPAESAKNALLKLLARDPADRRAQWLLNIACMALRDYPDGVPERFRIPASAFEAQHDVGRFENVAPSLGVDAFDLCGGVVIDDLDNDGLLDIFTSTSDPRGTLKLYRNAGDGSFEERSAAPGLARQLGGLNCIGGDYDDDGDVDILVLRGAWLENQGTIRNSLLRNEGNLTFTDVTVAAGLAKPAYPSQTAAWADFDNDGHLDLYVGNESRVGVGDPTGNYPNQLFRSNGDGTFIDVAAAARVTNDRFCKGVTVGDYDNDDDMDIFVSNVGKNRLYRNNGPGKAFTDVAPELGVEGHAGYTFAPWFFDYDNDGWLDLFVGSYSSNTAHLLADYRGEAHGAASPFLYHNNGAAGPDGRVTFTDVAKSAGLDHPYLPMGANFGDLDNDGFLDIYLATGDPEYETLMPNVMLRNDGGRGFQNVTFSAGLGHLQKGHGVAFADLDQDGDQDLYNQLGGFYPGDKFHNALFLNPGHGNRYLAVQLVGTKSNRAAVGARISVTVTSPTGPRTVHRAVGSVSSFGGSPTGRQEIGLGIASSIASLRVRWPDGEEQRVEGLPLDAHVSIRQSEEGFRRIGSSTIPLR